MSLDDPEEDTCPICQKSFDDQDGQGVSTLFQKGADKINESSRKRGREEVVARQGQRVHQACRRKWTNEKDITRTLQDGAESSSPIKKKSTRLSVGPYDPWKHCLFCGQEVLKGTHGHDDGASEVKTHCFPEKILQHCGERPDECLRPRMYRGNLTKHSWPKQ